MASYRTYLSNWWPFRRQEEKIQIKPKPRSRSKSTSKTSISFNGALSPWESKLVSLQSILIWEKPGKSALFLLIVNLLYWCLALTNVRMVSTVIMLALVYFLHSQWVNSIWPEISVAKDDADDTEDWTPVHPSVLSAPEISKHLEKSLLFIRKRNTRLLLLRRREPGKFCIIFVLFFIVGLLVGYCIPGVWILYSILMSFMCLPGFFLRILPRKAFIKVKKFAVTLVHLTDVRSRRNNVDELSEFLPEENADTQTLLGIPLSPNDPPQSMHKTKGTRRRRTLGNDDSNSFMHGLLEEEFPSIVDDEVPESELELHVEPTSSRSFAPEGEYMETNENIQVNNSATNPDINFVTSHFGGSSDEEEEFEYGLSFRESIGPASLMSLQSSGDTSGDDVIDGQHRSLEPRHSPRGPRILPNTIVTSTPQSPAVAMMLPQVTQMLGTVMSDMISSVYGAASRHAAYFNVETAEEGAMPTSTQSMESQSSVEDFEFISDDDLE